jgi:D-alanyl-D-alanine carboxypeptidase
MTEGARPTAQQLSDAAAIFEGFMRDRLARTRTPGASYAVHAEGATVVAGAIGLADIASGRRATVTTNYRCASITKTFTATLIMQLVEKGKVRLDEPVSTYLPWARPAFEKSGITVRHLLLHAGGVVRDGMARWADGGLPTKEQMRAAVLQKATFTEPSVLFRYSNTGYALLGEIIEAVSGKSFGAVLDAKVARPLGLDRTGASLAPRLTKELATGYQRRRPGEDWRPAERQESGGFVAAGGVVSNVEDLCRYQDAHMPGDGRLVSELSKREMQRAQWQRAEEPHHGYGWMVWHNEGISLRGHSGGFPGFVTQIAFAPDLGVSAAVLTNTIGPLASTAVAAWYGILGKVMSRWASAGPRAGSLSRKELAPLCGLYLGDWADIVVAVVNRAAYLVWMEDDNPMVTAARLDPIGRDRFVIADQADYGYRGEEVSFRRDDRGRVSEMTYGQYVLTRSE